jgi:hypothetical protein
MLRPASIPGFCLTALHFAKHFSSHVDQYDPKVNVVGPSPQGIIKETEAAGMMQNIRGRPRPRLKHPFS